MLVLEESRAEVAGEGGVAAEPPNPFGLGSVGGAVPEPDRENAVLTSVPDQELSFAREHVAGARIEQRELSVELAREHADVDVLSLMIHDPVEVETLEEFDDLDAIVTRSDGYDHLPRAWMQDRGVAGYHLHDYATESVAHHALTFVLAGLRRVPEGMALTLEESAWDRSTLMSRHLQDATIGVLGTGKIGSRVVDILTSLGAEVRGHDIESDPSLETEPGFAYADGLGELLDVSDVLSIHVPLNEATEGMIGPNELDRLGEGGVLVNTARGAIVDQAAVEQALAEGRLAAYAADVMPGEPEPPDLDRFQGFDNVVLTPHLAAYDERTTNARYERTARVVDAVLAGDEKAAQRFRVI